MLVSAKHQHESAILYTCPLAPEPPSHLLPVFEPEYAVLYVINQGHQNWLVMNTVKGLLLLRLIIVFF